MHPAVQIVTAVPLWYILQTPVQNIIRQAARIWKRVTMRWLCQRRRTWVWHHAQDVTRHSKNLMRKTNRKAPCTFYRISIQWFELETTNFVRIIGTSLEYGDENIRIHRKKYSSGRQSPVSDKIWRGTAPSFKVINFQKLARNIPQSS